MFEGQDKTLLFLGLLAAGFLSIATQSRPPDIETAVDLGSTRLPDLPFTAEPDGTPAQTRIPRQTVDLGGGFYANLMHGYVLEGEVVTQRRYTRDAVSAVSPLDLGIVWGDLADSSAMEALSFGTGSRTVVYRAEAGAVLPAGWEEHITNNHLIPSSAEVLETLLDAEPGDRIRIRGYLVTVVGDQILPWRSSTRRNDNTIIGGCEIILVRDVEILPEAFASASPP